jgi:hypothetical protein
MFLIYLPIMYSIIWPNIFKKCRDATKKCEHELRQVSKKISKTRESVARSLCQFENWLLTSERHAGDESSNGQTPVSAKGSS